MLMCFAPSPLRTISSRTSSTRLKLIASGLAGALFGPRSSRGVRAAEFLRLLPAAVIDLERCKRCGDCEKACPDGAVKMI